MNKLTGIGIGVLLLLGAGKAGAQITIRQDTSTETRELEARPDERFVFPAIERPRYRTPAMIQAERLRIRRERNTFEIKFNLKGNQTYFDNWAKGGSNFLNINATLYAKHIYKKEQLSLTTYLDTELGVNFVDSTMFKNADKLILDFSANWDITKNWSYTGRLRGVTQFANGYKNATDTILRSAFMSPGNVTITFGFTYKLPKSGFEATISPIGGQMLFVLNDTLSRQGLNGIDRGKHFKPTLGSNVQLEFNRDFGKSKQLNYRTTATAFYNYKITPQITWGNTLTIKATKLLSTTIKWDLIYDESVTKGLREGSYLQCKYEIGVGFLLNYNSRNRKK